MLRSPMLTRQGSDPAHSKAAKGRLESVQISNGGVPKLTVSGPVQVTAQGVAGDRQRDLRFHGGPERAVCLFSMERIEALRRDGHPIGPGTTGENLTISGLDWGLVRTGSQVAVGDVRLEVTKPADPCRNITASFHDGDVSRLSAKLHQGSARMYARVLVPGVIQAGDPVVISAPRDSSQAAS